MPPESSLDELLKIMESKDQGAEMPAKLSNGVLVDESYVTAPAGLNTLLFSPNSDFWPAVAELQGTSGFQIEPWKIDSNDGCLRRTLTYIKAASKLVKACKATEEQKYLKAAGNSFAVLSIVSTPDVPCGTCFKIEILYSITPGPQLSSEEQTAHLTVSWRINFVQSTMIKGMIENGAKQGMSEGYAQFSEVLSQKFKVAELDDANANKAKILASLHTQKEPSWRLIVRFLGNFTFIVSVIVGIYIITHLHLSKPKAMNGLEYFGIDLPDSIGEVVVCAVLILQGQNIMKVMKRFSNAWKQRGRYLKSHYVIYSETGSHDYVCSLLDLCLCCTCCKSESAVLKLDEVNCLLLQPRDILLSIYVLILYCYLVSFIISVAVKNYWPLFFSFIR
jgi:hypothetical protein